METRAEAPQGRGLRLALTEGVRCVEAWGAEATDRGRGEGLWALIRRQYFILRAKAAPGD